MSGSGTRVGILYLVGVGLLLAGIWLVWQGTIGWVRVRVGNEPLPKGCALALGIVAVCLGGVLLYLGIRTASALGPSH